MSDEPNPKRHCVGLDYKRNDQSARDGNEQTNRGSNTTNSETDRQGRKDSQQDPAAHDSDETVSAESDNEDFNNVSTTTAANRLRYRRFTKPLTSPTKIRQAQKNHCSVRMHANGFHKLTSYPRLVPFSRSPSPSAQKPSYSP